MRTASFVALAAVSAIGCDSCRRDRPYTPFRVDTVPTSLPSSAPVAASAASATASPATEVALEAKKLEPPLGRFPVGARQLELPSEFLAEEVLELPSTDPNQPAALVWVVPAKPGPEWNGPVGELRWFPLAAEAKKLFELPPYLPSGPDCKNEVRLTALNQVAVLLDVRAKCERSLPQRTPDRVLALFYLEPTPALVLGLRVAEPPADESLTISAVVSDRDGDGRVDPSFRFDLDVVSSKAHVTAALGWLDRAAGASMDEGYFLTYLEPELSSLEQSLKKKAELKGILTQTSGLRRLLANVCLQSAVPRVLDLRGEAIRCPQLQALEARLARLEVAAALGQNDPIEAVRAWHLSSTWLGGLAKGERDRLEKRIKKTLRAVEAEDVSPSLKVIAPHEGRPRFSPMQFEPDGTLLVQDGNRTLTRVALDGGVSVLDGSSGATAWTLPVVSPDRSRIWSGVVPACDRAELSLMLSAPDGSNLSLTPTRLLAPRPGVCRNPAPLPLTQQPIAWNSESPIALVDGACWSGALSEPCPVPDRLGPVVPGSPRSPDGRLLLATTAVGPVVMGGPKPELWLSAKLEPTRITDCVVANDARAIACVDRGAVVLVRRPATQK
ncbi:MAG TPA: hypothetical protein VKP30_10835 [Polyangiaceae bacterium]|nr:hypothetical protein [Polyangiaceae bacterium]